MSSWDYNYIQAFQHQNQSYQTQDKGFICELRSQLPQKDFSTGSLASTDSYNSGMGTESATDTDLESRLLPSDFWGEKGNGSHNVDIPLRFKHNNTPEEQRFLYSQLQGVDLWYSSDFQSSPQSHPHSQTQSSSHDFSSRSTSVFDMKVNNSMAQQPLPSQQQQQQQQMNFTACTTPRSSTPPPPATSSASSQFNALLNSVSQIPHAPLHYQTTNYTRNNSLGVFESQPQPQPQPQQQMTTLMQQQQSLQASQTTLNSLLQQAHLFGSSLNNTVQTSQPQGYLDQLQSQMQQQQQQPMFSNPLVLQQQAQLVAQQLQQLQLQIQLQQQQLETLNSKKLEADKLPLTQENLDKLQDSTPTTTKAPAGGSGTKSANSSENNKINTVLYKTELCSTFQRSGTCPYGSKCQFAHGEHELKAVDRGSKWRSKPCANWSKTGSCRYGNRCCFKHE